MSTSRQRDPLPRTITAPRARVNTLSAALMSASRPVTSITLSPSTITLAADGAPVKVRAYLRSGGRFTSGYVVFDITDHAIARTVQDNAAADDCLVFPFGAGTATLSATCDGVTATAPVTVTPGMTVTPAIDLTISGGAFALDAGASVTRTVTLVRTACDDDVALSASGLPTGVTAEFSPSTLSGATLTATVTVAAAEDAPDSVGTLTVTGDAGDVVDAATAAVTVEATGVVAPPPPTPSFTLSVSPSTASVQQGGSTSVTLSVTRLGGFTGAVAVPLSGLPSGVTLAAPVTILAGQTTAPATLNASAGATLGTATVTGTGSGTGVADDTATFDLTVTAAPVTPPPSSGTPTLPQATVDTSMPTVTGTVWSVSTAAQLVTALGSAVGGDVIELAAGGTFTGNFVLRARGDSGWVIIRPASGATYSAAGARLDPRAGGNATNLPKIVTANSDPAIQAAPGASGWRLVGLEITTTAAFTYHLVRLGDGQATSLSQLPDRILLDRCYPHGNTSGQVQKGVLLNGNNLGVIDSYLDEFHTIGVGGQESHVINSYSAEGPLLVHNNYIAGAWIGMMVGGADPKIAGLIPSDVTVTRNHFIKPLSYKGVWGVKNAFELKAAKRVLLEGNVIENNWVANQNGFTVLFQCMTQNNTAAWLAIADVTVRYNHFKNIPAGVNILSRVAYPYGGLPALLPTQPSQRILLEQNLFENVGGALGNGKMFQFSGDITDLTVRHNTGPGTNSAIFFPASSTGVLVRATFTDNCLAHGSYGVLGDSKSEGSTAIDYYAPGCTFTGNEIHGNTGVASRYPVGNTFPAVPTSPTAGCDAAAVLAATAGVVVP